MIFHSELSNADVKKGIKNKRIALGGNAKQKIFGTLTCKAGRRMNKQNRVFFATEKEATELNFRPCGHCMHAKYKKWKDELI